MRIPQNQIKYQYTIGKELMYKDTYKEYQGYYYEMNNSLFAGKEFNVNAPVLIKMNSDNVNILLANPNTSTYGKISQITIKNPTVSPLPSGGNEPEAFSDSIYFYSKKVNSDIIKKIDEDTFKSLQNNAIYIVT